MTKDVSDLLESRPATVQARDGRMPQNMSAGQTRTVIGFGECPTNDGANQSVSNRCIDWGSHANKSERQDVLGRP